MLPRENKWVSIPPRPLQVKGKTFTFITFNAHGLVMKAIEYLFSVMSYTPFLFKKGPVEFLNLMFP